MSTHVNYFDLGLYQGIEMEWMVRNILPQMNVEWEAYGFEAHPTYSCNCCNKFMDLGNVYIHTNAICDSNKPVKLYLSPNNEGHSIYSTKNNVNPGSFVTVQGIKFSDFLRDHVPNFKDSFNIIKCNIEGAEWMLINDLIENDLLKHFDVYCGKWDDVEKIEELKDKVEQYYKIFEDNGITVHRFSKWKPQRNADLMKIIKEGLDAKG